MKGLVTARTHSAMEWEWKEQEGGEDEGRECLINCYRKVTIKHSHLIFPTHGHFPNLKLIWMQLQHL